MAGGVMPLQASQAATRAATPAPGTRASASGQSSCVVGRDGGGRQGEVGRGYGEEDKHTLSSPSLNEATTLFVNVRAVCQSSGLMEAEPSRTMTTSSFASQGGGGGGGPALQDLSHSDFVWAPGVSLSHFWQDISSMQQ